MKVKFEPVLLWHRPSFLGALIDRIYGGERRRSLPYVVMKPRL